VSAMASAMAATHSSPDSSLRSNGYGRRKAARGTCHLRFKLTGRQVTPKSPGFRVGVRFGAGRRRGRDRTPHLNPLPQGARRRASAAVQHGIRRVGGLRPTNDGGTDDGKQAGRLFNSEADFLSARGEHSAYERALRIGRIETCERWLRRRQTFGAFATRARRGRVSKTRLRPTRLRRV
jgi:hypothetical protein